jgi:uncharacterized protein (DUF342 family)
MSDTDLRVLVSQDRCTAELLLDESAEREIITAGLCRVMLEEAGVLWSPEVEQAVNQYVATMPPLGTEHRMVVARSHPPVHGLDEQIIWCIEYHPPSSDEKQVSHYERSPFIVVSSQQVIGKRIPATSGTDGTDVTGRILPAKPGRSNTIQLDETILVDGQRQLIAQSSGVLMREGGKASIRHKLVVSGNVDFATGNIDFPGPVEVKGGIRDCFIVRTTDDLEVFKLIESATIDCRGSLRAHSGIATNGMTQLTIGRDLTAHYLNNVRGCVGGSATINREIINCELHVEKQLHCPSGSVIGGNVTVAHEAIVGSVGSTACVRTRLVLGTNARLDAKLNSFQSMVDRLSEAHHRLLREQQSLEHNFASDATVKERLTEIAFEIDQVDQTIHKFQSLCDDLRNIIATTCLASLTVNTRLYPGVRLVALGQEYQVASELKGPLTIRPGPGRQLTIQYPGSDPVPLNRVLKPVLDAA